ncbi:hypothetical protein PMAYCL1PPCAC_12284, partial [Pristionchus mayeri]
LIPWSSLFSTLLAQINTPSADLHRPTYPIDSSFYNQFLTNQAQLNQALLMPNNLLPAAARLPAQQGFTNFQNLVLNPSNIDLFNQQLQNLNQLPSQPFFDPLAIQSPLTDIQVPTVIPSSFVVPPQRSSESYLGGIPPSSDHANPRALSVKSFVGMEKSSTSPLEGTTKQPEDSEQVRLIRRLLEETLAEERKTEKSTVTPSTTQSSQKEDESSIHSVAEFSLLEQLNLNETEKKAIVARVEELLRVEIARKLLSTEISSTSPSTTTTTVATTSTTSPTPSPFTSSPPPIPSTTSSPPITPQEVEAEASTVSPVRASPAPTATPSTINEKMKLKSLAQKQKKSTQVGGRSIVRPVTFSESIDEPSTHLRVNSVQKEIRESQPRLPTRYIHNTKKDVDEDFDLIYRSGGSDRRPENAAAASLLTSARRITYPRDYEETVADEHEKDFFQPITGAPLDLSDVDEEDEEGGIVDLDLSERRREQLRAIATSSPFSLRTTARPFDEESTTQSPSPAPSEPLNLETVTTPPFRNGRHQHRATKFEVLASDYRSRLGEYGDLGHILKRLSHNAYIALIESDGGKRTRHESRSSRP